MGKNTNRQKQTVIEKFELYAGIRGIKLDSETLGLYEVRFKYGATKRVIHEAVRGTLGPEGKEIHGWVINTGNDDRQRKFYADEDVFIRPYTSSLEKVRRLAKKATMPFRRLKFRYNEYLAGNQEI